MVPLSLLYPLAGNNSSLDSVLSQIVGDTGLFSPCCLEWTVSDNEEFVKQAL